MENKNDTGGGKLLLQNGLPPLRCWLIAYIQTLQCQLLPFVQLYFPLALFPSVNQPESGSVLVSGISLVFSFSPAPQSLP